MRLAYYAGASTAAAAACLLKAFHQRPNFYSATVYLSQSNACLLVITNLILVMACSFIYGLQRLLYGPLRPIEIEQLSEKAWYAVLDTLLAMPSFREDVGGWLLAMFTLLLAGKVWGWIGEGRVDILEQQPPANPALFHFRLATSLTVSVLFDIFMLDYCAETVLRDPRPGMMVIFTFEFAILSVFSLFTLFRYMLNVLGIQIETAQMAKAIAERKEEIKAERAAARQNETEDGRPAPADSPNDEPIEVDENEVDVPGWENKRRYLFGLEVITDFVKLLIYILFFTVSITFNGLPMHIMRDVYMTFASFSKRVGDYIAYRKATSDMNTRYPDATTEEIRGDSCIVCREEMVAWEQPAAQQDGQPAAQQPEAAPAPSRRRDEGLRAKKLPCGHILHLRCLKAWLERQQVCPTCRRPVVTAETAAAPGQPAAPGANPPAAGQQPQGQQQQQQPRRQNRARIFDFGPVRIGFVNGPGANIGNIVRQMQNPNAPAAQNADHQNQNQNQNQPQNQNQNLNQQGPNHLGLQDPYITQRAQLRNQVPANGILPQSSASIQIQLMQLEQRLMEQARNHNLEQQQYQLLRAMEAELARLRTFHIPDQQPVGISATAPPAGAGHRQYLQPSPLIPAVNPWTGQPDLLTPVRDVLQNLGGQTIGNGREGLPEGMVLPEGWTLTPLQHMYAAGRPTVGLNEVHTAPPHMMSMNVPVASSSATAAPASNGSPPDSAEAQSSNATAPTQPPAVPVNEDGSPFFVPAEAVASTTGVPEQVAQASTDDAPALSTSSQTEQATPWGSQGWSFSNGGSSNGHPISSEQATGASQSSNENNAPENGSSVAPASSSKQAANLKSTGEEDAHDENGDSSIKAAHVEDVPDDGN